MGIKETMMGFAEKLGDTVDKGVKTAKDSYNDMAEKNRIKKEIKTLTGEVTDIFASVGRRLYNESPENEQFKAVFAEAKDKENRIAELKIQLDTLENDKTKTRTEEVKSEVVVVEAEQILTCSQCGERLEADSKFCNKCGTKVE